MKASLETRVGHLATTVKDSIDLDTSSRTGARPGPFQLPVYAQCSGNSEPPAKRAHLLPLTSLVA